MIAGEKAHICNHCINALHEIVEDGRPSRLLMRDHLEQRAWGSVAANRQ
jgi:hypothetical protein